MLPQSPLFKEEFETKWTQYDPDLANQLLDGLGLTERNGAGMRLLPDGRPMQIVVETAGEETEQTDVLELIRDHWRKIGISLFIKPSQREVFYNRVNAGATQMSVWSGLENALLKPSLSPAEFTPMTPEQFQWPAWGLWVQTSGQMGEEPDLEPVKQLIALKDEWGAAERPAAREARSGRRCCRSGPTRSSPSASSRASTSSSSSATGCKQRARARRLQFRAGRVLRHLQARHLLVRRREKTAARSPVIAFLARRFITMVWTLVGISVLVFVIIQLPPGDYLTTYIAEIQAQGEGVDDEKIAFLREQYGLDKPLWQQYFVWATACCTAISAIPSNTTSRSRKSSATGCS